MKITPIDADGSRLMIHTSSQVVRPAGYWYAVSMAVLVVGVGLGYLQIIRSTGASGEARPVRGRGEITIDRAGSYSLYVYRGASQRMDQEADRAWAAAKNAEVSISGNASKPIAVKKVYEEIDLQNTKMARLVEFEIPAAGEYRVVLNASLDAVKPAIRPSVPVARIGDEAMGVVFGALAGLAIGAIGVVAAAILFFVVRSRRKKFRKESALAAARGAGT